MSDYEDFDLDTDVADVQDIISFSNPPKGVHVYRVTFMGLDNIGSTEDPSKGIRVIYQHVATEQKGNAEDMDVAVGSIFDERFNGGEKGKEWLKKRLMDFYGELSGSMRPYIEGLNSNKPFIRITTSIAKSKSKKDGQVYDNVRIQDLQPIDDMELPEGYKVHEYEPNVD